MRTFLGLLVGLSAGCALMFFGGGTVGMYLDVGAACVVLCGTAAYLVIVFPTDDLRAWLDACFGILPVESVSAEKARFVCETGRRAALALGLLCALGGGILMLANLTDVRMMGRGMAVALIGMMYALLVSEFFFHAAAIQAERRATAPAAGPAESGEPPQA